MQENKSKMKQNLKWIVIAICIIIILIISVNIYNHGILKIDTITYEFISEHFMKEEVTVFAKCITNFCSAMCLMGISILLFCFVKSKKLGILVILNLCISYTLNTILKSIFQRPRPVANRLIEEVGYSFPSAHAMVSTAFYGFLIYLIYKSIENKYIKWSLITVLSILIILIGISRIYLGVHYTSDVLVGLLISICYLIVYIEAIKKIEN